MCWTVERWAAPVEGQLTLKDGQQCHKTCGGWTRPPRFRSQQLASEHPGNSAGNMGQSESHRRRPGPGWDPCRSCDQSQDKTGHARNKSDGQSDALVPDNRGGGRQPGGRSPFCTS